MWPHLSRSATRPSFSCPSLVKAIMSCGGPAAAAKMASFLERSFRQSHGDGASREVPGACCREGSSPVCASSRCQTGSRASPGSRVTPHLTCQVCQREALLHLFQPSQQPCQAGGRAPPRGRVSPRSTCQVCQKQREHHIFSSHLSSRARLAAGPHPGAGCRPGRPARCARSSRTCPLVCSSLRPPQHWARPARTASPTSPAQPAPCIILMSTCPPARPTSQHWAHQAHTACLTSPA